MSVGWSRLVTANEIRNYQEDLTMDKAVIASIVIGVLWVSVAIAATLLQKYVQDDPRHKAEPSTTGSTPLIPRQRQPVDEAVEADR